MSDSKMKRNGVPGDSITVPNDLMIQEKVKLARTLLLQGMASLEYGCDEEEEDEGWNSLHKALAILEEFLDKDHFEVAQAHIYLGNVCQNYFDFHGAKEHAEIAMGILDQIGPAHPEPDDRRGLLEYFDDVYGEKQALGYNAIPKRPGDPLIRPEEAISDEAFDRFVDEQWEFLAFWFCRYSMCYPRDVGNIYAVLRADPDKGGEIYYKWAFEDYLIDRKRPRLAGLVRKWSDYSKGIVVQYLRENGRVRTVLLRGKKESETPFSIYSGRSEKDSSSSRFRGFDITAEKRFAYSYDQAGFFSLRRFLCRDEEELGEEEEDELDEENEDE